MVNSQLKVLNINADQALFDGKIDGLVVTCYENERPLLGLAGLMDWRFSGFISECVRLGILTGKKGELTYIPLSRHNNTYHLIFLGNGKNTNSQTRSKVAPEVIKVLKSNLMTLKLDRIGLSWTDMGESKPEDLANIMEEGNFWIVQ